MAGAVIALACVLAALPARAEDSCRSRCWDAYGACYKSTSNRPHCQGQLLRCLSNCIRAKRAPASLGASPIRDANPAVNDLDERLSWSSCGSLVAAVKRALVASAGRP